jgi:hypothetical protein
VTEGQIERGGLRGLAEARDRGDGLRQTAFACLEQDQERADAAST